MLCKVNSDRDEQIKSVHITNYYHETSGGVKANYNKLLEAANQHKRYVRLIVPGETEKVQAPNFGLLNQQNFATL